MILKLYKTNYFLGLLFIPIVALLMCIPILFSQPISINYSYYWEQQFFGNIQSIKWLNFILTVIIIVVNALLITRFFNKSHFFSKTTYSPAIVYLTLLSFSHFIFFNHYLIEHLLLILLITQLIEVNQNQSAIDTIFKSSLLIGCLFCLSPYYLILFPFGLIALSIMKAFSLREWLVSLLGISIPLIWFFSLQFIFDRDFQFTNFIGRYHPKSQFQIIDYIQIGGFLFLGVINLFPLFNYYSHNKIIIKKHLLIILTLLLLNILTLIIAYNVFGTLDYSIFVALSIIISLNANNVKSDAFISFLLTLLLLINIVSLYY